MKLYSWDRFITRSLTVSLDVIGRSHRFSFDGADIEVKLPGIEQVRRDKGNDKVASVGARLASDDAPLEYHIEKVDVHVYKGRELDVDHALLSVPANAYELMPRATQEVLKSFLDSDGAVAARALEYWLSVLRWVTDDYRIGRHAVDDNSSGWSTHLHEVETGSTVWIKSVVFMVPGYHQVTLEEWNKAAAHLSRLDSSPLHIALKHDAQEFLELGDCRRSLIDLAVACETFLRKVVLERLPAGLAPNVWKFVEEGNINQFAANFFPALLRDEVAKRYRKTIKEELASLFAKRNDIMHRGDTREATEENCQRFLALAGELFGLLPDGLASAPVPESAPSGSQ